MLQVCPYTAHKLQCFSRIASLDVFNLLLHTVPYPVHHCLACRNIQNEIQNESEHMLALCSKHRIMPLQIHPTLVPCTTACGAQQSLSLVLGGVRARHSEMLVTPNQSLWGANCSFLALPFGCATHLLSPAAQRDAETDVSVRVKRAWLAGNEWEFDYAALQSRANTIKRPAGRTWRKEIPSLSFSSC